MLFIVLVLLLSDAQGFERTQKLDGVIKLINEAGYPVEKTQIQTADGYILSLHRIPNPGRPPVLLMPGLLSTAADFIAVGAEKSLGFFLFNNGYDVWLPNARGTTYGRSHLYLNPNSDKEFWNFSWHEIGMLDIPAMIDYVLKTTGKTSLQFLGHSQGTTAFFVMAAQLPEYNKKIRSAHLFAPAGYVWNVKSSVIRLIAILNKSIQKHSKELGIYEFYPYKSNVSTFWRRSCMNLDNSLSRAICSNFIYLIGGTNEKQFNYDYIKNILQNYPGGSSGKQFDHFSQLVESKRFCQFDYGRQENLRRYASEKPPDYPLQNITSRVYMYYGTNDYLTVPKDVKATALLLTNLVELYNVLNQDFTHFDFLWGKDADKLIYWKLLQDLGAIFNKL